MIAIRNKNMRSGKRVTGRGVQEHVLISCFVILILLPYMASSLRCYQCYSNSLEPCPFEDLQECPRYSFYNRCSVKVRKMITGEMFVKRECSLGCSDGSDSWNRDLNVSTPQPCFPLLPSPETIAIQFPLHTRFTGFPSLLPLPYSATHAKGSFHAHPRETSTLILSLVYHAMTKFRALRRESSAASSFLSFPFTE